MKVVGTEGCQRDVDEKMPSYAINTLLTGMVTSCLDRRIDMRRVVWGSVARATRGTRVDEEEGREDGFWTCSAIRCSQGNGELAKMRGGSDCVCLHSVRREGEVGVCVCVLGGAK